MAESESPAPRRKLPWAITFFGLLVAAGLIAMPILAGPPQSEKMPDIVRFFGHFHPLFLHLPIGVFVLITLQELGAIFFRTRSPEKAPSLFPMFFGVSTAVLAVVAGFLLYHGGDYQGALAERHLWGGIAFGVAALITFIVQAWSIAMAANLAFYRLLLFMSVGLMSLASHDGGSITHGSDHLIRYAPEPIRKFFHAEPRKPLAEPKPPQEQLVYVDIVAPIFERRCVQCHKEGNSKGRLRMDTYELLLKGGKEGPALVAGSSEKSNLVYRIELPLDDEHMPPTEKPQMDANELLVVKWWIDSGADPARALSEYDVPADVQAALAQLLPASSKGAAPEMPAEEPAAEGPGEDVLAVVDELGREFPGALTFESRGSRVLTFTAVSVRRTLDDDTFAKFAPVVPHLVTLDLSGTRITDRSVALLAEAGNLRSVRLAETAISDVAIDTLANLPNLESVNLYGTRVTDDGVVKLAQLPNLKRLYLWQTDVSEETIANLREKMPDCEIVTGI